MERAKNKRESRRSQSTGIVNEVNQLVQSDQFKLSTLHVLHGRLKAVQTELAALNAELETFLTDEQVAEDYDSVMEYEDAATSALALLERHMNRLKQRGVAVLEWSPQSPDMNIIEHICGNMNAALCSRSQHGLSSDNLWMRAEIEGHGDASRF
ncbi:hypothetical protein HPB52_010089 [Rhipicephalus sanguineus]|uniref:Uncharacterized protein n=1 Tax=Rhipicephalus sanguineus TaxID=34632 RepID=A0A9D4T3K7_RHISA|nr:hypothetical protein HPB52_010089 [Rhipicephalus sanguineus]